MKLRIWDERMIMKQTKGNYYSWFGKSKAPQKYIKKKLVRFHKYLGPLYTLWVKANVQLKSSIPIGAKSWNQPQGLFTLGGVKPEIEKIFSICHKLLKINAELYSLVLVPRLKKRRVPLNLVKPICNPWGQCSSIY